MGKLKISSELLRPLDHWNLAWAIGPYLGLMGKLKISSELLRPLDYWNLAWATGPYFGRMSGGGGGVETLVMCFRLTMFSNCGHHYV